MTESNKRTTSAAKVTIVLVSIALLVMAYTFVGYAGPPMVEIVNESSTVLADVVLIGGTGQWEIPVGDIPSGATETVHVSQIEDWLDECEISIRFAVGGREYYRDDCGALLSSGYAYKIRLVVSEGLETRPFHDRSVFMGVARREPSLAAKEQVGQAGEYHRCIRPERHRSWRLPVR